MLSSNKPRLTKRAPDAGDSAVIPSIFHASAFFSSDGVPPSAPAQVTHTVRPPTASFNQTKEDQQMANNPPKRQAPKPKRAVIRWLLDSDPSIRWQVMRDLTGAP